MGGGGILAFKIICIYLWTKIVQEFNLAKASKTIH